MDDKNYIWFSPFPYNPRAKLSHDMRKPDFWVSDTNQPVQLQKMVRMLKFSDLGRRGIVLSMYQKLRC